MPGMMKTAQELWIVIRPDPLVFLAAIRNKLDQSESDHEMLLSLHDYVEA